MRRFLLVLTLAAAACVPNRGRMQQCTGAVIATVRNNWQQPVDVYARMRETSGFILGEVAPGERREFELPEGATGVYYEWRRATILRPTSSDISTAYACR